MCIVCVKLQQMPTKQTGNPMSVAMLPGGFWGSMSSRNPQK